jgi:hypothetical protein
MRHILIVVAIVIAIPSLTLRQAASQNTSCEQTAKELESRVSKITQSFDKTGYEQFVSDDVVIIGNNGEVLSKKQEVASLNRPPDLTSVSFTTKDMKIRVCGETSILVTGKDIITAREKGEKESAVQSYWFTRLYEKRRGQWQLVYEQLTDIAE